MSSLSIRDLTKRFGHTVAVERLSLDVHEGSLLAVLGPSGSGKSTALRLVAGLERPDSGAIEIGGRDVTGEPPARRGVAMVFQGFALFPHLTAADNVVFGLSARGVPDEERRRRLAEVAERLELGGLLARRPAELSGGERQRVALARALVGDPRLLLMDEPLSNLDAPLRAQARAEVRRAVAEAGVTTVYVTHDQAEALSLGSRVAVIREGRLQQVGVPREVYERPANAWVARFVGSPPMNLVQMEAVDGELRADGLRLPLPAGAGPAAGRRVLAGFRPEAAHCPVPGGTAAEVVAVEEMGHERVWQLRAGPHDLFVRPAGREEARPGDTVRFSVDGEHVRLFDPDTGEAL